MAQRKLPQGWCQVQLGDVVSYGKAKKCVLADVTDETWVLELEDVEKESSRILSRKIAKERPFKSTKNRFEKGNVLYGKLRPYLNKVVVAESSGVCTTEIIPLDAEPFVLNRYLFHWLKTRDFLNYVNEVSYGVNMPRLGTKDGVAAPFVLAPLAEQKAIADKLDTLLAQVETTKARLERIPQILKRFRQSVLAAAVSGRLTEEWRKNQTDLHLFDPGSPTLAMFREEKLSDLPESWSWLRFDQVAEIASNLIDPASEPDAIHIAPNHIEPWTGLLSGYRSVSEDKVTSPKHRFFKGQILYSKIRPYLCKVVVARFSGMCSADMYPINSKIDIGYLYLWMLSSGFTAWASTAGSRSVLPKINQKGLGQIPVPTPSVEEQAQVVCRVTQLFAHADRIEQQVQAALARVNNLTQSILAKAFLGELTEQWRNDNPELISGENSAEALLEKIKAEREAMRPAKKSRAKAKPKPLGRRD